MRDALAARRAWWTRRCTGEGEQENKGRPSGAQGLVDPAAMARLALAEALTNLVWAAASGLADVKASVNWMYAAKMDAEGAAMYDAAAALRDAMLELGLACDGGKDSLSMAAAAGGETVKVPWTLQDPGLALASCCSWPLAHAIRLLRCTAPPSDSPVQCLPGRQGVCCRLWRVAAAGKPLGDVQGVAATLIPPLAAHPHSRVAQPQPVAQFCAWLLTRRAAPRGLGKAARPHAGPAPPGAQAPGNLVVSAYVACPDITLTVTPDLKLPGAGRLVHVDLTGGRRRLGGSALAHAYGQARAPCASCPSTR